MPPACSTSTATRRPCETTSLKKSIMYFTSDSNMARESFRRIIKVLYSKHARLGWRLFMKSARRFEARGHWRRRSCSYATMFQTEAQQATLRFVDLS